MGLLSRIYNLWTGFLSIFVGNLETKRPEIAYENAINSMTEKYAKLKSAAAGLIKNRTKLESRIKADEAELSELQMQIDVAVEEVAQLSGFVVTQSEETAYLVLLDSFQPD